MSNSSCTLLAAAWIDIRSVTPSCTVDTLPVISSCLPQFAEGLHAFFEGFEGPAGETYGNSWECTGLTRISEEISEIVFLLVENYHLDRFKWASSPAWEFLKLHYLNPLALAPSS
ncbi:hypothetical protein N7501_003074 [Penicillium viridicatum]|nr:hypothetical protein N7501_003074 [Penicillium viridicatum]